MSPPSRAQQLGALKEANRVRTARARLKRDVRAGTRDWTSVLENPDAATMRVGDLLRLVPKIGAGKTARILRTADLAASKTLACMTVRQRDDLRRAVRIHSPQETRTP